jgi:1-acyl-sn-glycerol-3-phosphate acyltransferase
MDDSATPKTEYDIDVPTYDWSVRIFRQLKRLLKVSFRLHGDLDWIEQGHIFLFNHFARFESIIPQYLFHEARRTYCCSVASQEFFDEGNLLSGLLRDVGGIPKNHPHLLPNLAGQILRGRKVVIFPEGGMVKDRRVLDQRGRYSVYSRSSLDRRKHHTGAAVLGLGLELFKTAVRRAERRGDRRRLALWAETLKLEHAQALLAAARQPTVIIPANITFYPIRIDDHALRRAVAKLSRGGLSRRLSEELLIEGNILLRHTDMDIQFGPPIYPGEFRHLWENRLSEWLADRIETLDDVFTMTRRPADWEERLLAGGVRRCVNVVRNAYMREIYRAVTVNLSHLASTLIMACLDRNQRLIDRDRFHRALYLAVNRVRNLPQIHLHAGLRNPDDCLSLLRGEHPGFREFIETARKSGLLEEDPGHYRFLPKLRQEHALDEIRIENPVAVYANEVEPIAEIAREVERALDASKTSPPAEPAALLFSEEVH